MNSIPKNPKRPKYNSFSPLSSLLEWTGPFWPSFSSLPPPFTLLLREACLIHFAFLILKYIFPLVFPLKKKKLS